jgi:LCP family protein required for cell wall assembly
MAKKKPKNQPKQFDIHRSLPRHTKRNGYEVLDNSILDKELAVKSSSKSKRGFTWKKALALLLLLPIIFLLFIGIWDARNFSHASKKMFGSSSIFNLINSEDLQTDNSGRVNVLIVGYSVDDPGHPAATLTDSILVLSMNPSTKTGYMLSIPRDLYVNIPNNGYGKINEAYRDGGIAFLERIVNENFQIKTPYYVLVDYKSVRDIVNALGGITVNIQSTDPRGLFDPNISPVDGGPLKLRNGPQTLNGQSALNLTRARGDPCLCGQYQYGFNRSDFDRTQHQRQVFTAIKDRINWKLIVDPRKNEKVFNAFADNLKTNLQLDELRPLYTLFNSIPTTDLNSISLDKLNGKDMLSSYNTPYGQSALIPAAGIDNYSLIVQELNKLN